jgi:transketolase
MNAVAPRLPTLIGGSADLNPSTHTALSGLGDFEPTGVTVSDKQGAVEAPGAVAWRVALEARDHPIALPRSYRDQVFLPAVHARLAAEAGASQGWHRYVGDRGDVLGVDRYGASALGDVVMREYGFTVDNLCKRAMTLLG